jgi:hypothetical protein
LVAGIDLGFLLRRPHSQSGRNIMATLNHIHRHPLAALAAALAVSFGAVSQAGAAGLACKPDIYVKNRKPASIKVLKLEYMVEGDPRRYPEALDNKRLAPGEEDHWSRVKLGEAAVNIWITQTRVQFKNDNSGAGDGYGPPKWSDWHTHTEGYKCQDGRNYAHYLDVGEDHDQ